MIKKGVESYGIFHFLLFFDLCGCLGMKLCFKGKLRVMEQVFVSVKVCVTSWDRARWTKVASSMLGILLSLNLVKVLGKYTKVAIVVD